MIALACATAFVLVAAASAGLRQQRVYEVGESALVAEFVKLPGDKRLDLVATARGDDDLSVLRGARNGRLRSEVEYPAGEQPQGVAPGDFNRDGRVDLAVANQTGPVGGVTILISAPGGGFILPAQTFPAAEQASYLVAAQLTADRKLDLAITGFDDDAITVLKGDGTGDFDPLPTIPGKPGAFPIGAGDFDRDGKTDLVVAGFDDDELSFYEGVGNGQFRNPIDTDAGQSPNGLAVGRINADRKLDVAVANYGGVGSVSVLLGRGNGRFDRRQIPFTKQNSPADVEIMRFDDDRYADLVFTDSSKGKLVVLRGKRRARFRTPLKLDAGGEPYGVAVGKLAGDSHPDVAAANSDDGTVSVYRGR